VKTLHNAAWGQPDIIFSENISLESAAAIQWVPSDSLAYFNYVKSLLNRPILKQRTTLGSQFEKLQSVYLSLTRLVHQYEAPVANTFVQTKVVFEVVDGGLSSHSWEELVRLYESDRDATVTIESGSVLEWVITGLCARDLLRRISRKLQSVREILYQRCARFCGLSWSRRLWFLLHGSHPPKLDFWQVSRQEFECA